MSLWHTKRLQRAIRADTWHAFFSRLKALSGGVTLALLAPSLSGYSMPEKWLAPEPCFKVGVELRSYWPRYGITETGHFAGYARELLDAYARDSGYRFEYVALSYDDLLGDMLAGRLDLRYPDNPGWARPAKTGVEFSYSRALDFSVVGINVPPQERGQTPIKTIGVLAGFSPPALKNALDEEGVIVYPTASLEHLAIIGGEGWVDSVYGDPYVLRHYLSLQGFSAEALVFDYSQPQKLHDYSLSTTKHPGLMEDFNRWFKNHYDVVLKLRRKYGIYDY